MSAHRHEPKTDDENIWRDVKSIVDAIHDCEANSIIIVEAILLSNSPSHLFQLVKAAYDAHGLSCKAMWGNEE